MKRLSQHFPTLLVRLLIGIALIVIPLRDYLFANGLYIYRDWSWPLSTQLTPRGDFSPNALSNGAPDPFGFSRMFLTWPIYVIDRSVGDTVLAEKIFVVYLFSIFIVLAYAFSTQLLSLLRKLGSSPLLGWRAEAFVSFMVVFCFANFWSLQQLSDLYYTYIIEFLVVAISLTAIVSHQASVKTVVLAGTGLSFCILLDPNLYAFALLALSVAIIATVSSRKSVLASLRRSAVGVSILFAVSLPALLTMILVLAETSGTGLRAQGTFLASTANLTLPNSVRLLGYWWSLIAYAPPSILWSGNITQLPAVGSPTYMILPQGVVTAIWLAMTWLVPAFAFSVVVSKRYRTISVPATLIGATGIVLTQPSIFPFPYLLVNDLASVPIIGGALLTVLAIPDHILIMVIVSYAILVGVGSYAILTETGFHIPLPRSRSFGIGKGSKPSTRKTYRYLTIGLLAMLLFPSWQLFSGSFFPSGYVSGYTGNGIPATGAFAPSRVPQTMVDTYNWFLSQKGDFNVYWPGPEGATYPWSDKSSPGIAWVDSPRPTFITTSTIPGMFPAALQYLIASNLTGDIAPYLASMNVKYLVLQPYSPTGLDYSWGINNFGNLQSIIRHSPGINLVRSDPDIWVYEVSQTWGTIYSPDVILGYSAGDEKYSVSYAAFSTLGVRAAFSRSQSIDSALCVDSLGCSVSMMSPSYLSAIMPSQTSLQVLTEEAQNYLSFTLGPSDYAHLPSPDTSWTLTNWGSNPTQVNIGNTMEWSFSNLSVMTLSYNGTVTNGNPGGLHVPPGNIPIVRLTFTYRTSNNSDIAIHALAPALNSQFVTTSIAQSEVFPDEHSWTTASFNTTLSTDATYFTTRIQAMGTRGDIELKDVIMNISMASLNAQSPFGLALHIESNDSHTFRMPEGYAYYELQGSGSISQGSQNMTIDNNETLTWFTLRSSSGIPTTISGDIEIACVVVAQSAMVGYSQNRNEPIADTSISASPSRAIVFARMFDPGYSLNNGHVALSPIPTLDGLTLFVGVGPGVQNVVLASTLPFWVAYAITLITDLSIILAALRKRIFASFQTLRTANL